MRHEKYKIVCIQCDKEINCSQPNQKLCSDSCRDSWYGRNKEHINEGIPSGTVGAMSELRVSTKLLQQGYAVFRALSPSCFCDIIAVKNDEFLYLEVRTGRTSTNGTFAFPKQTSSLLGRPTHYAVYVFKTDEMKIIKI